jgi:hypothetical protein
VFERGRGEFRKFNIFLLAIWFDKENNMMFQIGYNNGVPIDEEFFIKNIAGRSDEAAAKNLFPDWDLEKGLEVIHKKDVRYRMYANFKHDQSQIFIPQIAGSFSCMHHRVPAWFECLKAVPVWRLQDLIAISIFNFIFRS